MNISRTIGATLIFSGTCIGAGMLALPIATAQGGFFPTLIIFAVACLVMIMSGILIIEINSWLGEESNMVSMAKDTLGTKGAIIAWILFLLLLNAGLCAYISGSAQMLTDASLKFFGINLPITTSSIIVTLIIAAIVYFGTHVIDEINRLLMFILITSYFMLVSNHLNTIDNTLLLEVNASRVVLGIPIIIASFTGHFAIPSLRAYLHSDFKHLKQVVILGCVIPLVMYSIWLLITLGNIPINGEYGLIAISKDPQQMVALNNALAHGHVQHWLAYAISALATSALITSFLGVTMSLTDFLQDGLQLKSNHANRFICLILALVPALLWSIYNPDGFTKAMDYAGTIISMLLLLLPVSMAWRGRYYLNHKSEIRLPGGKPALLFLAIMAVIIFSSEIINTFDLLSSDI